MSCSSNSCNQMGYWSSKNAAQGSLYLKTNSLYQEEIPFCNQMFKVVLKSPDLGGKKQACGTVKLLLKTATDYTEAYLLDDADNVFKEREEQTLLFALPTAIHGDIEEAFIFYERNYNFWFNEKDWYFESLKIFSADLQKEYNLCSGYNVELSNGKMNEYTIC